MPGNVWTSCRDIHLRWVGVGVGGDRVLVPIEPQEGDMHSTLWQVCIYVFASANPAMYLACDAGFFASF